MSHVLAGCPALWPLCWNAFMCRLGNSFLIILWVCQVFFYEFCPFFPKLAHIPFTVSWRWHKENTTGSKEQRWYEYLTLLTLLNYKSMVSNVSISPHNLNTLVGLRLMKRDSHRVEHGDWTINIRSICCLLHICHWRHNDFIFTLLSLSLPLPISFFTAQYVAPVQSLPIIQSESSYS